MRCGFFFFSVFCRAPSPFLFSLLPPPPSSPPVPSSLPSSPVIPLVKGAPVWFNKDAAFPGRLDTCFSPIEGGGPKRQGAPQRLRSATPLAGGLVLQHTSPFFSPPPTLSQTLLLTRPTTNCPLI
uniref:Uncharacterized protein n=1 Tax=Human herpesvirus 1 TaxID=10298 RepID=A0A2U9A5K5_HHV1|nr:hypothetical protein [Human alphaherpesvirus 1]